MNKRKVFYVITGLLIAFLILEVIDYYDLPSVLGFKTHRLNLDFQSITISSMLTVVLFILAYYLINRWEVKKHINQYKVVQQLLLQSYKQCIFNLEWLDDRIIRDFILNSRNDQFDKNKNTNDIIPYEKIPFQNDEMILQISKEGVINDEQLIAYLEIKNKFSWYVSYLSLHRNDSNDGAKSIEYKSELLSMLNRQISQIESDIKQYNRLSGTSNK